MKKSESVVQHSDGREGVFRCLPEECDPKLVTRFNYEIPILAKRLDHPNVVTLYDWSCDKGTPWYISELGTPFRTFWEAKRKLLADDPPELVNKAVLTLRDLATGLAACHEKKIVHRDVKVKNIVCKRNVDSPWPILIDFGLAHDQQQGRITSIGDAVGNAPFSPDVELSRLVSLPLLPTWS